LKLADAYSTRRLEAACEKALRYRSCPGFRNIKTILKTGSDMRVKETGDASLGKPENDSCPHAFTRGNKYYGGKNDGE